MHTGKEKIKPSFLCISNWYPAALTYFKADGKTYEEHKTNVSENMLDIAHLYALNLNNIGYPARAVISNHETLQKKWADETGARFSNFSPPHLARKSHMLRSFLSRFPTMYQLLKEVSGKGSWERQIVMAQMREFKPDTLVIFDLHHFTPQFLEEARKYTKKIIGVAYTPLLPSEECLRGYDFLFSPFPPRVRTFREMGIPSAELRFAFESSILERAGMQKRIYDCVFIGGLGKGLDKIPFLEKLAQRVQVDFWGHSQTSLDPASPILRTYHGQAWGIELHTILAQSKIVVNLHTQKIGNYFDSENYADNVRLYESTGAGALLITDAKRNLHEIFDVGKEVESYTSLDELVEKIKYFLKNDFERERIARAGQERTLREHTYAERAKQLIECADTN